MAETDLISQMFRTVVEASKAGNAKKREEKLFKVDSRNEQYFNVRVSENELNSRLGQIYDMSGINNLSSALEVCYSQNMSRDQMRAVCMVSEMICRETGGKVIPPCNIYHRYQEIAAERQNSRSQGNSL